MVVDYDLVVVGDTLEAREAAQMAAHQGARVALSASEAAFASGLKWGLTAQILAQAVASPEQPADWGWLRQQLRSALPTAYPSLSLEQLSAAGVDVVLEPGQFSPRPHLAWTTAHRRLTARAYLLACGAGVTVPAIAGLERVPFLTPATLLQLEQIPPRLVVLGRGGDAIATAQTLALLGSQVTLITRGSQLLPDQDAEMADWARALLAAAGAEVRLNTTLKAIHLQGAEVQIKTAAGPVIATHLLLATAPTPQLQGLNLERIGLQPRPRLAVDSQLRTAHRRIYACGALLGGRRDADLARHEVQVAVANALYLPRRRPRYDAVPLRVMTRPEMAWVGMSESQARRWYGEDAVSASVPWEISLKAHLREQPVGACKLVVHRSGRLLGAQLVGPEAGELVQTLTLWVGRPVDDLRQLTPLPHSFMELLVQAASQWQHQRWQPGCWRRDWAENWFNWRRTRQD